MYYIFIKSIFIIICKLKIDLINKELNILIMEKIKEQIIITKEIFIQEYYKHFEDQNNQTTTDKKLFTCNMTGDKINVLSDIPYIKYADGHVYKWDMIVDYIDYIYSFYQYENIMITDYENTYILDVSYNGNNIKIEFCKNFETSFHSYISHPYHKNLTKYLIFPIYKDLVDVKPYIKTSNLKYIKKYFEHGDIVYTGDNHYIMKCMKKDGKKWKSCDYSDEYENHIFIPFEYIQSRGYIYYKQQSRFFDIASLTLDFLNNEIYDFHTNYIICNVDEFVDDKVTSEYYLNSQEEADDIDVESSPDIVSSYFGELIIKNDKLHVHITKETTVELPTYDIAPHFIKSKGFTYYYNIAQECRYELMVLISPFEVLNLNTMVMKNI